MTDRCSYCPAEATGVVVTVNGWVIDMCDRCALAHVDVLFGPRLPDTADLPPRHRLLVIP
jgi:hypothetical protein